MRSSRWPIGCAATRVCCACARWLRSKRSATGCRAWSMTLKWKWSDCACAKRLSLGIEPQPNLKFPPLQPRQFGYRLIHRHLCLRILDQALVQQHPWRQTPYHLQEELSR
ncbi:hypothetical protein BCR44DRAFT_1448300 [Catenaria anguillulae PL171]|uniref:Uncharacterized protein n=1 Tax=Catenaria anguillulae PL171 TaxID=765915 RepID=A0A1Y2H542_9FUNG|nr:hypothetical protein BCR44DRAFT_1448300 [Catenaria anguillulae PL171]